MAVSTVRRYFLLKARALDARGEEGLALAFRGKLSEAPGTPLPEDMPARAALHAAGYTALEDLDGATVEELVHHANLNRRDAEAVLAALP